MINRKSIVILVGILVAAYVSAYFYTTKLLNSAIIDKLNLDQDRIVRSGFPFAITFKLKDHDKFKRFSYNPLTKKLELDLNFIPKQFEDFKYKKYNIKDLEHLRLSAKLESYFAITDLFKSGVSEFDLFNHTNDFQMDVKATTTEPNLIFDSSFVLSFPNKRKYRNMEDIKSDFPRILSGFITYNIGADLTGETPSFVRKISEIAYPETTEIYFDASSPNKLDFKDVSKSDLIKYLLSLNLKFKANSDSKIIKSEATMDLKPENEIYYAHIKASEQYKGNAIKTLYNSLSRDDVAEFALLVVHDMGLQLSDDTKQKIRGLTDLIWDRMEDKIKQDPNYLDKFSNLKTNYITELQLPTHSQIKENAKLLIHIPNDSGEFEFKLDGLMEGGLSAENIDGHLFVTDKDMSLSEALAFARLLMLTIDKKITSDHFNIIASKFDEDVKTIASELKTFTDNPESESSDLTFTYKIDMKNPMASTISKNGNNILEFLFFMGGVFTAPPSEPVNIPNIDQAIPPVTDEVSDVQTPPADQPEELDL